MPARVGKINSIYIYIDLFMYLKYIGNAFLFYVFSFFKVLLISLWIQSFVVYTKYHILCLFLFDSLLCVKANM